MKKNSFLSKGWTMLVALLLTGAASTVVSCSSDDDEEGGSGSLNTPKYENESALYNITSSGSDLSSIELTASGNYVITKKAYYYSRMAIEGQRAQRLLTPFIASKTRAYDVSDYITGKYTKKGDGVYELSGFGTIKVVGGEKNSYSLEITRSNGSTMNVSAQKADQYKDSAKTNALCRTWKFTKIHVQGKYNGKSIDKTYKNFRELMEDFGGEIFDNDQCPEQVLFTKSGTYIVFYDDGELAVSTWAWKDEAKGIARYSWDYDDLYDDYESDIINIDFAGSQLVVTETINLDEYEYYLDLGYSLNITAKYYFVEV